MAPTRTKGHCTPGSWTGIEPRPPTAEAGWAGRANRGVFRDGCRMGDAFSKWLRARLFEVAGELVAELADRRLHEAARRRVSRQRPR